MQKKILIIGGGEWQIPIIRKAKSMGYYVINTNLYENSPGFEFADQVAVVDVLDLEHNLKIAKKHQVDAVVTDQSDIAVKTVAYVAEKMALVGVSIDIAELYTNKYRMRKELKAEGLSQVNFKLCHSFDEALAFLYEYKKIVIKPIDSQSSRGVFVIESALQLKEFLPKTISFSQQAGFLAEEFIEGAEITVEGFKPINGRHKSLAVSQKSHIENTCIANSLIYKQYHKFIHAESIEKINDMMFSRLPFGITHVEYKVNRTGVYLIEAAIRGGGTNISSDIIPLVSGVDVNELLLKSLFNNDQVQIESKSNRGACALVFFEVLPGKVVLVEGESYLKKYAQSYSLPRIGQVLAVPTDDRSRAGFFIVGADNDAQLSIKVDTILEKVKIKTNVKVYNEEA